MQSYNKSVLVVHAHPDDTEAFCAGALKLLHDKGYKITIATMTGGGMGGIGTDEAATIERRLGEAERAAAVLDADYVCLGGRDGYLYDTTALRVAVTDLIRKTGAGVLFTHLPTDYHSDHRTTCNIVESAALMTTLPNAPCGEEPLDVTPLLYHTAPLSFTDPFGRPAEPHFALDITSVIDAKMEMLSHHESQIELMSVMHKIDNFFDEMKKYNSEVGRMCGCDYAEIYWQHLGGGFQKTPLLQEELKGQIKDIKG